MACRSLVFWNIGKPLSMPLPRDPDHRKTPKRTDWTRPRTRQSHFACRSDEIQITSKPLRVQLYRNPDHGRATRPVAQSRSRPRQSHKASSSIEIQITSKPQAMAPRRDLSHARCPAPAIRKFPALVAGARRKLRCYRRADHSPRFPSSARLRSPSTHTRDWRRRQIACTSVNTPLAGGVDRAIVEPSPS
jgi:hypothetical protein